MGAGGQTRALYIDDKGNGTSDFYVGSDVAGVWKAGSISNGSLNDFTKYNYEYISNHEIMRFVNKFYRSTYAGLSDYIFTCNQSGIHKIERNATNGNMQKIVDIEESDVSDMHIASLNTVTSSHSLYFVTGDTRLDDDANVKATGVYDFYFTTITPAGDINTPIQGVNFTGLGGQRDVYCLYVNDKGTPDETDDEFLAGTENGLYMFNFGNLNFVTHSVAATLVSPPLNSGAYSVSSISAFTTTKFFVTIYGATSPGIFLFSTTQPYWIENYSNGAVFESSKVANSTIKYSATSNELKGFAKLQRLTSNAGYLVFLTEPDTKFGNPLAKYYTGIYYAEADAGNSYKPKNSWANLEFDNSTNDYGWNNSRPCANINSCVLNTVNRLWVGKSGNFFVTDNNINNAGSVWKKIYTTANTGCTTTIMSYSNRGMVNTVPNAIFPDPFQPTRIFNCNYDRHLNVSNNYGRSFEQVTISNVSPGSSCFWIDDSNIDYSLCNITDPTFSDCFTITNNPYDIGNFSLYIGFAQGYSTKKGVGVAYELNNGSNILTPFGGTVQLNVHAGEVCGDPIKIVFNPALPNDKYCIYNMTFPPTDRHLFKYNATTFAWDELDLWVGVNEDIIDAVITNNGALVVINGNTNARGVHKFTWASNVWTPTGAVINPNVLGVQLEPFLANGKTYLICKATGHTGGNVTVIDANTWTVVPVNVQCGTASMDAFNNLIGEDDRTSCIGISEAAYSIYISTAKGNRTYLYKGSYNPTTGEVLPCWDEITGMPNKIPKYINTNRCTATKENLYISMRGLGEWQYCPTPFNLTATNPTCAGGNDGNAAATINCDRFPYTYLWSTSAATSTITNLAAGTYTVTVTDGYGISSTQSITLYSPCCGNTLLTQANFNNANTISSGNYNLNSSVILGANVTIDAATIKIAGSVSITVPFGKTLTIQNASNLSACTNMWQGIINEGGTVILRGCTINDAIETVASSKNGIFEIHDNTFNKNRATLVMRNGDYTNSVTQNNVEGNSFLCSTNLLPPFAGTKSLHHILLKDAIKVKIGDENANANIFEHGEMALQCDKCNATVFNNTFDNYTSDATVLVATNKNLTLGSMLPNTKNTFNNCAGGIMVLGCSNTSSIKIEGNNFNATDICIGSIFDQCKLEVSNNTMTNTLTGIAAFWNSGTFDGNFHENTIAVKDLLNSNTTGISIGGHWLQGIDKQTHYNIEKNVIHSKGDVGITFSRVRYCTVKENHVYLDHTTSLTSPVFGIKAEQLEASDLTCNLVNDDLLNPVYKTGFQFYDCPNNRIEKSITQDIETGIAVIGNNANSEFRNNEFTNYIEGFVIGDKVNAVPTTVEYLDLLPNLKLPGNLWYGGTDETYTYYQFTPPPLWTKNGTGNPDYPDDNNAIGGSPIFPNTPGGNLFLGQTCNIPNIIFNDDDDTFNPDMAEMIAAGQLPAMTQDEITKWKAKQLLYVQLKVNESLRDSIAALENFYDSLQVENIGKLDDIASSFVALDYAEKTDVKSQAKLEEIKTKTQAINSTILPEVNEKKMSSLYANTIAVGIYQLNTLQKSELLTIANQSVYAGGPAVISARNWVRTYDPLYQFDENFLCAGSVYRKKATEIQNVKQELILNVVPNPTSGAISLESNLPMDGTLQMVDLVGKVNCTMELKTPLLYINLDFSKLANGSYILIYKSINGTSKHIKFEIIK